MPDASSAILIGGFDRDRRWPHVCWNELRVIKQCPQAAYAIRAHLLTGNLKSATSSGFAGLPSGIPPRLFHYDLLATLIVGACMSRETLCQRYRCFGFDPLRRDADHTDPLGGSVNGGPWAIQTVPPIHVRIKLR